MELWRQEFYLTGSIFALWCHCFYVLSASSTSNLCTSPCVSKKQPWMMPCTNTFYCKPIKAISAATFQITCRSTEHQYIAWWACEPSTSWCKDTSPPYSLQRQNIQIEIASITMTGWSTQNVVPAVSWGLLRVSSEVISNLSLTGWQGASRCLRAL